MSNCRGCHNEFTPKRKGQEYHDRKCFLETTVKMVTCPECNKEFKKTFSKQVCCSQECANTYRAKKNTKGSYVTCSFPTCTNSVYKMPSRLRKYNFCSVQHKIAYLKSPLNTSMSKGWKHREKAKEKIRQAGLNRDYDKVFTEESRRKMADSARNKVWTDEAREKLRKANLGKKLSIEHKEKIKANAKYGKDNFMWGGDNISYQEKHIYAGKYKEEKKVCAMKGKSSLACKGRLELSHKDNVNYTRNPDEYTWLCSVHHDEYEYVRRLVIPKGLAKRFYAKYGNTFIKEFTVDGIIKEATIS